MVIRKISTLMTLMKMLLMKKRKQELDELDVINIAIDRSPKKTTLFSRYILSIKLIKPICRKMTQP
jgi:hypothetical protein